MMRKLASVLLIWFISIQTTFASDEIEGIWDTGENNTVVEIVNVDGMLSGKVVSTNGDQKVVGTTILSQLKRANGGWQGRIYSVKRNKEYDVEILRKEGELELAVDAGFFTKTINWSLIKR